MFRPFLIVLFLFILQAASAQLPQLQWVKAFEAHPLAYQTVVTNGRAVAVDHQGNVYSTGLFTNSTDFDPGPGTYYLSAPQSTYEKGIYVSKLSPTGDFVWAFKLDALVEFGNIEICVDQQDNIYVVSELRYTTDFDPGPGVFELHPTGGWDAFVAKYDPNGNLIWAKQFGGPGDTVPRSDVVTVDNNNNVIVCGNFNNTVDFDPGPGTFNITSSAHIQSFITKLTPNGDFIWAKQFGNGNTAHFDSNIADVKCDGQGNIFLVGNFSGSCDFDPGPGSFMMQATGMNDGYIAKLTSTGDLTWVKRIGNTSQSYYEYAFSRGIAVDNAGNVYTTGEFIGTFDLNPGPNTYIVTSANYDWYVLKLNAQGDYAWAAVLGGSDADVGAHLSVDNTGNVYAVGSVSRIADMDPGPGNFTLTSVGQYGSAAIVKLNTNGGFVYASLFDGNGSTLLRRMTMDNSQNIYVTGYMYGTIDYEPGPNVSNLYTARQSPYVLKLGRCSNVTTATINVSACNSYTLNNQTYDTTGTYYTTIPNATGCDSLITLHLTINKKFASQNVAICQGTSFFAGGGNQTTAGTYVDTLRSVLNCDSIVTTHLTINAAPKPDLGSDKTICTGSQTTFNAGNFSSYLWQDGSTDQTFTTTQAGTYYVTVKDNRGCQGSDTVRVPAVMPLPEAFLGLDTAVCSYSSLLLKGRDFYASYLWNTNATTSAITITTPGTYWLQVRDEYGCIGRDSINVTRKECLSGFYMPNAFTPDNNRHNDFFKPIIGGVVKQYELTVYNRWGQLVFKSKDATQGWDGTFKGAKQETNVFVWVCSYQLEGQPLKIERGTVVLVR